MAKFNVNQSVIRVSDGKYGVIRAREVKSVENYTDVKYLVDFGDGIEKWVVCNKKDIVALPRETKKPEYIVKTYEAGDRKVVTMAAYVEIVKNEGGFVDEFGDYLPYTSKGKILSIGFSIYNGTDDFDQKVGEKFAKHRCKTNPFTTIASSFTGEFNKETIEAIMDVKAKYIIENIDRFYRPQ